MEPIDNDNERPGGRPTTIRERAVATAGTAHATRVEQALDQGLAARSAIAASWARSARLHQLHPATRPRAERLSAVELGRARERLGTLVPLAAAQLDRVFALVAGLGGCVVLADADGIVLERRGRSADDRDFAASGLWTGADWSEAAAGTNGIGTCVAEDRVVTIHRDQHFLSSNIDLSCSSAPIHDPAGAIVAVLDVSTARAELTEAVTGLLAASVAEVARRLEIELFQQAFARARLVLVPRGECRQAAVLAVDADDLVIGATRAARVQLGLAGDLRRTPRPLADVIGIDAHDRPAEAERAVVLRALARADGNATAAARSLGISRATLYRKLQRQ